MNPDEATTTAIDEVAALLTAKGIAPEQVARFKVAAEAGDAGSFWFAREIASRPDGALASVYRSGTFPEPAPLRSAGGLVTDGGSLIRRQQERSELLAKYGDHAIEAAPALAEPLL